MKKTAYHFIFLLVFLLGSVSCDKGLTPVSTEPNVSENPAHTVTASKMPSDKAGKMAVPKRKIVEPEFLKGAWKAVKMKVVDKSTGKSSIIEVPLNKPTALSDSELSIEIKHYFPGFLMTQEAITSVNNEESNPAAYVIVHDQGNKIMEHWIFAKMPQVHSLKHDRWSIYLVDGIPAK